MQGVFVHRFHNIIHNSIPQEHEVHRSETWSILPGTFGWETLEELKANIGSTLGSIRHFRGLILRVLRT